MTPELHWSLLMVVLMLCFPASLLLVRLFNALLKVSQ
jgi:hypothetical protein